MISLKKNRIALINLQTSINAIDEIDELIKFYSDSTKTAPVYLNVKYYMGESTELQMKRNVFVDALRGQRVVLVKYLADLGIDANS
jgi:hypothetical protein